MPLGLLDLFLEICLQDLIEAKWFRIRRDEGHSIDRPLVVRSISVSAIANGKPRRLDRTFALFAVVRNAFKLPKFFVTYVKASMAVVSVCIGREAGGEKQ